MQNTPCDSVRKLLLKQEAKEGKDDVVVVSKPTPVVKPIRPYSLVSSGLTGCLVAGGTAATAVTSAKSVSSKSMSKGRSEMTFSNATGLPHMSLSEKTASQIWTHVEESVDQAFATTSNAGAVFAELTVQLSSNVNDYTSLIAAFDQYRCTRVQCWLVPRVGPSQISATANVGLCTTVVDYDDASAPTYAQLLEYRNALTAPGVCGHYRDFKPHTAMAVYAGAFTSFANMTDVWLDCASSGVYYYGMKAGFEQTDAAYVYDLIIRTTWEFRNQR